MSASSLSPELMMSCRSLVCWSTMRAPVLVADMSEQAWVSSLTASVSTAEAAPRNMRPRSACLSLAIPVLRPTLARNCLISGWKMMIRAMAPTSMMVPIRLASSFMPTATAKMRIRTRRTMAMKLFTALVPLSQRNST